LLLAGWPLIVTVAEVKVDMEFSSASGGVQVKELLVTMPMLYVCPATSTRVSFRRLAVEEKAMLIVNAFVPLISREEGETEIVVYKAILSAPHPC
jgi:DUF4097 and DUF4098 domain-containing protein YvlB